MDLAAVGCRRVAVVVVVVVVGGDVVVGDVVVVVVVVVGSDLIEADEKQKGARSCPCTMSKERLNFGEHCCEGLG